VPRTERHSLGRLVWQDAAIILIAFLGLGATYSVLVPLFESPDEVWHYEYVRYLTEGNGLPVSDMVAEMPWHQEGSQPPLYYLLGASLTFWVDTGDAEDVIRYNPHAAVGLADAPDNKNKMAHTHREAFPYRRTVLAVHLVRLLSVLMGAGTVACAYRIAMAVFPERRGLAAMAAAITAFNPQFIFISASANNDNLVTLLSSVALLLLVRFWQHHTADRARGARSAAYLGRVPIYLGLVAGLTAISKLNGLVLLPFIAVVLMAGAWRRRSLRLMVIWGLQVTVPVLAVAGWWYWRNWSLYGDPFGLAAMYAVLPARTEGPRLSELLARAPGVWRSAWAVFGWFNVTAEPWLYAVYSGLSVIGLAGLGCLIVRRLRQRRGTDLWVPAWLALWSLTTLAAVVGWSQKRYPQGRLLFPALAAFSVLLATGLTRMTAGLPVFWRRVWAVMLSVGLAVLAAWAPFRYIAPAYAPPQPVVDLPPAFIVSESSFGGVAQLLGYQIQDAAARPGERLDVTLYWRAVAPMKSDYSVFLHLVDSHGLIAAQRDSYPGGGSLVTSEWPVGPMIADRHTVQIPVTAVAPSHTTLCVGLYDYGSGTRVPTGDGQDGAMLGAVSILPAEGASALPNPVYFDFESKVALVGFDLDRRVLRPGDTLRLTLHWQAISTMAEDYTVFTHLLLPPGEVWAQKDAQPQQGQAPTSTWQPGQTFEDHYGLTLPSGAPPGVYEIEVGVYLQASGDRLRVGLSDEGIVLGAVRVEG